MAHQFFGANFTFILVRVLLHRLFKMVDKGHKGIIAAVVQQIHTDLAIFRAQGGQGQNFGRIDNGRIQPGCHRFVEKNRIQHFARRRTQAEGDIAHSQSKADTRQFFAHLPNSVQGFNRRIAHFLITGTHGEGQ